MRVEEIIKITKGELIAGDKQNECEKFSKDTRTIEKGDIYIGIKGEKFNGNKYWKEAIEKGAKGVIIEGEEITEQEKEKYKEKIIIKVKNILEALYEIAKKKREKYDIPVIAITGSVGKTSTKDIIASVTKQKYKTLKTEGNNNNNIGLPFTILKLKDEEIAVIEMGMNHLKEISLLTEIAKPTLSIITNIGTSHIGNLGSRENILKAKLEILEGMEKPEIIINNDNDILNKWQKENKEKIKIHTYGIHEKSETNADKIIIKEKYSEFETKIDGKMKKITVPVGGEHFIYNALCAIQVGKILGLTGEQIEKGIKEFQLTQRRMDIKKTEKGATIINDSYNASYESMKASIKYLAEYEGKRKIAVLGDMFELGDYAKELHEKVGKEIKENKIDILICAGKDSKYIIQEAKRENEKIETYLLENNEKIVEKLQQIMKKGDIILVKASNGMKFFEICQKL